MLLCMEHLLIMMMINRKTGNNGTIHLPPDTALREPYGYLGLEPHRVKKDFEEGAFPAPPGARYMFSYSRLYAPIAEAIVVLTHDKYLRAAHEGYGISVSEASLKSARTVIDGEIKTALEEIVRMGEIIWIVPITKATPIPLEVNVTDAIAKILRFYQENPQYR